MAVLDTYGGYVEFNTESEAREVEKVLCGPEHGIVDCYRDRYTGKWIVCQYVRGLPTLRRGNESARVVEPRPRTGD